MVQTNAKKSEVLFLVDRDSFPVKCEELYDFISLVCDDYDVMEVDTENPSVYFNKALEMTEYHELVIPVTRNFYIRDKLKMEGVTLVICI